ncbi:MAG: DUF6157 family protein [Edaphocola sp.]
MGQSPSSKGDKKTIAEMQYELLANNPYKFTSDDFATAGGRLSCTLVARLTDSILKMAATESQNFLDNFSAAYFDKIKPQSLTMKTYTLDEVKDELIGKIGTPDRDRFEYELQMDLIGKAIKQTRQERNLTQEELGKLIGVQKAQISRLENNAGNVTMDTLLRVFTALKAKVKLQVELANMQLSVG